MYEFINGRNFDSACYICVNYELCIMNSYNKYVSGAVTLNRISLRGGYHLRHVYYTNFSDTACICDLSGVTNHSIVMAFQTLSDK